MRTATADNVCFFPVSRAENFFQSSEFQQVLQTSGWKTVRLQLQERGHESSVLAFAPQKLPFHHGLFPCFSVFYGPCLDHDGTETNLTVLDSLLKSLLSTLKHDGATSLDVRTPFPFPYGYKIFSKNGFTRKVANGDYSVFIDLRKDQATLWSEMKRFARRNVKKAIAKGVEVRGVKTETELHKFYEMYIDTGRRRGFGTHPYRLLKAFWTQLEPKGAVKFLMAWWKDKPIGGILNTFYDGESVPYIACSLSRFWDFHPNHMLFWHSMIWSKEVANSSVFKIYHLPPRRERVQGIDYYTFKTCFGGRIVEECTSYEKIISPVKLKILQALVRLENHRCSNLLMNEMCKNMGM